MKELWAEPTGSTTTATFNSLTEAALKRLIASVDGGAGNPCPKPSDLLFTAGHYIAIFRHITKWRSAVEPILTIARALSDENRLRALLALRDQEVCVCQLIELLQLAPSTVSKHMSILKQARLVVGRKKGRWMHYRLPGKTAARMVRQVLSWVRQSASEDPRIQTDAGRMKKILATNRSLICKRQSARRKQKGTEDEVAVAPGPFY